MNERFDNIRQLALQTLVICLFAVGIVCGGFYALDKQAAAEEPQANAERQRHVRECNAMIGTHRRECLKEVEVAE